MNKLAKVTAAFLAGALAVLVPTVALADNSDVSLKLDPGVAVPLVQPQVSGSGVGFSSAAKLWVGVGPYFSFGPSASVTWLGSNPGTSTETTFGAGWGFMLRRPLSNNDRLTLRASPWVDTDFQLNDVRNASSNYPAPSVSVGAGVSFPLTVDRSVWVGPFARFENVFGTPNNSSYLSQENKIGILGVSFEFGQSHLPPPAHRSILPPVVTFTPPPAPPVVAQAVSTLAPAVPLEIKQKIQFAFDSANLQSSSLSALDEIAKDIQDHANYSVTVRGYASSEGDPTYNVHLSLRRAETVVNYLTSHSVDPNRVMPVGMGILNPVADNSTAAGRQLNRRVDFVTVVVTFTGNK